MAVASLNPFKCIRICNRLGVMPGERDPPSKLLHRAFHPLARPLLLQ